MIWVTVGVLRDVRPMWLYVLAATLFVLSQVVYFFLNKVRDNEFFEATTRLTSFQVICKGTMTRFDETRDPDMDGMWIVIMFETAAVIVLYCAWCSITEGDYAFWLCLLARWRLTKCPAHRILGQWPPIIRWSVFIGTLGLAGI